VFAVFAALNEGVCSHLPNMPILLVTYDINKEGTSHTDRDKLLEFIKSQSSWAYLSESAYAVETNSSPTQLFEAAKKFLDENDSLMIFTLSAPYFGRHSQDVIDWFASKL